MKEKPFKMPTKSNKRIFQNRGVIFEREGKLQRNAIVMCHWPYCGMDAKTARKFAKWLLKRADEMETKETEWGMSEQKIGGSIQLSQDEYLDYLKIKSELTDLKAKYQKSFAALQKISAKTYGTEICNTDEENNAILANHFFLHQNIARQTIAELGVKE